MEEGVRGWKNAKAEEGSYEFPLPIQQVGMDELENQTICEWRDSEKKVTTLKSTLMQIDPRQRSEQVKKCHNVLF